MKKMPKILQEDTNLTPNADKSLTTSIFDASDRNTPSNKNKIRKQKQENVKSGRWSKLQNNLYKTFLQEFDVIFKDSESRRKQTIFKRATQFIKNRTATQIRSHHQKMMKKHYSIQNIIKNIIPLSKKVNSLIKQRTEQLALYEQKSINQSQNSNKHENTFNVDYFLNQHLQYSNSNIFDFESNSLVTYIQLNQMLSEDDLQI